MTRHAWPLTFLAHRRYSIAAGLRKPLILDGAMGTELAAVQASGGLSPTQVCFAYLSAEGLESIRTVSRKYCESGADVICTGTYNVNDVRYARDKDEYKQKIPMLPDVLKQAVELTREVVEDFAAKKGVGSSRPLVAAAIGGYGVAAEQGADYDFDYSQVDMHTLVDFHRRRVTALLAGKPDILLFETISSLKEVHAIVKMLLELKACAGNPPLPEVWLACACRIDEEGKSLTCCGDSWKETVQAVEASEEITAFGINCTWPSHTTALLKEASSLTQKPLIAYPNNGTWHKDKQEWLKAAPAQFAEAVCEAANTSPKLNLLALGGCCCTGPADIEALAKAVHRVGD